MAINKPIFDAGASSARKDNKQLFAKVVPVVPPGTYFSAPITEDGQRVTTTLTADRIGQFVVYLDPANLRGGIVMYVVVDVLNGEGAGADLQWKQVVREPDFIDSRTGRPWDPMVGTGGYS